MCFEKNFHETPVFGFPEPFENHPTPTSWYCPLHQLPNLGGFFTSSNSIDFFEGTFVSTPFERGEVCLLNSWLYIDIFIPYHLLLAKIFWPMNSLLEGAGGYICNLSFRPIQMEFNSTTWFTGPPGTCATNQPWGCIYVCHSYVCYNDMKNHGSQNIPFPQKKRKLVCQSFLVPNQHREQEEGVALRNCCKATSFPGQRGLAEIGA